MLFQVFLLGILNNLLYLFYIPSNSLGVWLSNILALFISNPSLCAVIIVSCNLVEIWFLSSIVSKYLYLPVPLLCLTDKLSFRYSTLVHTWNQETPMFNISVTSRIYFLLKIRSKFSIVVLFKTTKDFSKIRVNLTLYFCLKS